MPEFTILTAVLNRRTEIERMIHSVRAQLYRDYELLIVDNGSTDGTYEFCLSQAGGCVRVIRAETRGLAFARNAGLRNATGDWVVILDSDNSFARPDALRLIHEHAEAFPGALGFFFGSLTERANGERLTTRQPTGILNRPVGMREYLQVRGETQAVISRNWFSMHQYPEVPGAATEFPWCVWFALAMTERLVVIDVPTQLYTDHGPGRISSAGIDEARARELYLYYRMLLDEYGAVMKDLSPSRYWMFRLKKCIYGKTAGLAAEGVETPICEKALAVALPPARVLAGVVGLLKRSRA